MLPWHHEMWLNSSHFHGKVFESKNSFKALKYTEEPPLFVNMYKKHVIYIQIETLGCHIFLTVADIVMSWVFALYYKVKLDSLWHYFKGFSSFIYGPIPHKFVWFLLTRVTTKLYLILFYILLNLWKIMLNYALKLVALKCKWNFDKEDFENIRDPVFKPASDRITTLRR